MSNTTNPYTLVINGLPISFTSQGSGYKYSFIYLLLRLGEAAHAANATAWAATSADAYQEVLYRFGAASSDAPMTFAYLEVEKLFASVGH